MSLDFEFKSSFGSDNHAPIHPKVLEKINRFNYGHAHAYGFDEVSLLAKEKFREHFGPNTYTYFVFNGTAANILALKPLLKSYQAVIATDVSHLNQDECGAPEALIGTKIICVPNVEGKLKPELIEPFLTRLNDQHAIQPRVISITQPTELGTVYTLKELQAIGDFAKSHKLLVHLDGARLANAAFSLNCTFGDIVNACGAKSLSFGGTKNGLMGAEAVLLFDEALDEGFKYYQKQFMQLSSKTRFIAAQFLAYFEDDLWLKIASRSCQLAQLLASRVVDIPGIELPYKVQSNAVFARIPKSWTKSLKETCFFYVWDEKDWVVRWMMSFDLRENDIDRFLESLKRLTSV